MVLRLPALRWSPSRRCSWPAPCCVPAVLTVVLLTQLVACGVDNYVSCCCRCRCPPPAATRARPVSGTRGLGAAALAVVADGSRPSLLSAPFAFLAWLPYLLGTPWLWALTLPLALAGAAAVYFMLGRRGAARGGARARARGARGGGGLTCGAGRRSR